jgi:phosphatidylglycerol---prolipoprotein diacylglyceryl transferase
MPVVTASPAAPAAAPEADATDESTQSAGWAERALRELLVATCWIDPGEDGGPYPVTVRFTGRRTDADDKPGPGDSFRHEETFEGIIPGSGPVALTATIPGISEGTWDVETRPVSRPGQRSARLWTPSADGRELRPRRVPVHAGPRSEIATALLPFTKVPGVIRYAWATLVGLGILAGLALQAVLIGQAHLPAGRGLIDSLYVVAGGIAGAKVYYIVVNRGRMFDGWCVQGSVLGGAVIIAMLASVGGLGMPAGAYLASATVALLAGVTIGRPGCFWAGCCVGRPTTSRLGIWSSDRRVGVRRLPAQPLEALLALTTGLALLVTVLLLGLPRSGWAAVAALAVYTCGRQFILGAREDTPRRTPLSGPATAAAAAAAAIAAVVLLVITT